MSDPPPLLRFVVLRHDGIDAPHFDLMIEETPGSPLRTWRCEHWPIDKAMTLTPLANHRRDYLDYEGPVSGGRGFVTQVESGTYRWSPQWDDPYVLDLTLFGTTRHDLWLLCPPGYPEWQLEQAS